MAIVPGSLYVQPWWLDAVAPGEWGETIITENEQVVARMPYVMKTRLGFRLLVMPPLTQSLGPWIAPLQGKYATRLSREHELLSRLIEQLPEFDFFRQSFHSTFTNWLPFYWRDFSQTTRYTYVLPQIGDIQSLWANLRGNIRREIRKGEREVRVRESYDIDALMKLCQLTFSRQGLEMPFAKAVVQRIVAACRARNCCRILIAADTAGQVHSGLLVVWHEQCAYYLLGGSDPALRTSGAASLLMWRAIQLASEVSRSFDFEGSMLQPVERFFRGFGAKQRPYHRVTKINSRSIAIGLALAGSLGPKIGRYLLRE